MENSRNENPGEGELGIGGEGERQSLERMGMGRRGVGLICDPLTCLEDVKGSIFI